MLNSTINSTIRAKLADAAAHGRIIGVEYVKKDGSIKRAAIKPIADGLASIITVSGAQAAETRAANNPNLYNYQDVNAYSKARAKGSDKPQASKAAWRSLYLDNVLSISDKGTCETFRIHRAFNP
ncbi:MAG: hypothetical protein ACKO0Z_05020 [Betaproteobacteria bacterium]